MGHTWLEARRGAASSPWLWAVVPQPFPGASSCALWLCAAMQVPNSLANYLLGLPKALDFWRYMAASTLGIIPSTAVVSPALGIF